ncbi:MAG: hypothetical protein WAM82_15630 [Thermoanaerobaculia bacterium]
MALRKAYMLGWMAGGRLLTLRTGRDRDFLPLFTSEESVNARRLPIPSHGVLIRWEVWADERGGFKLATVGGGLKDLVLDWKRLHVAWDTDPGFEEEFARGVERLREEFRAEGTQID